MIIFFCNKTRQIAANTRISTTFEKSNHKMLCKCQTKEFNKQTTAVLIKSSGCLLSSRLYLSSRNVVSVSESYMLKKINKTKVISSRFGKVRIHYNQKNLYN